MRKPKWLDKKVNLGVCRKVKELLREFNLHTVCEESLCPNISECFYRGMATFMILGNICTRRCNFCAVNKGTPQKIDSDEPKRVKAAVKQLNLNYVVITSPARDDLADGGAEMFSRTIKEIKEIGGFLKVEILIPDFLGNALAIEKIADCGADIIAHNLETVPSLYPKVRKVADYNRSVSILKMIKKINRAVFTKSGVMLGLGESNKEIINVMKDLRQAECDFLTLGQYLAPSVNHYPVKKYISPQDFIDLEKKALSLGFKQVKSSPYIRSSYLAHTFL